jgi:hypothetical protein
LTKEKVEGEPRVAVIEEVLCLDLEHRDCRGGLALHPQGQQRLMRKERSEVLRVVEDGGRLRGIQGR